MPEIYQVIFAALFAAFIVLVSDKAGIRDKVRDLCDAKRLCWLAKMLNCDFCFGFWLNVIFTATCYFLSSDTSWLFVPIFSAPLTRYII